MGTKKMIGFFLLRKSMNNIKHAKIKYCKYSEIRQNIRAEMLFLLRVSIS